MKIWISIKKLTKTVMRTIFKTLPVVVLGAALALAACEPEKKAATYELPAIEDIVMYQVNPRVFAPDSSSPSSLQVVARRVDSAV